MHTENNRRIELKICLNIFSNGLHLAEHGIYTIACGKIHLNRVKLSRII